MNSAAQNRSTVLKSTRVFLDINDEGKPAWMVVATYLRDGKTVTVPDGRGWPTRHEAEQERARIEAVARA